MTELIWCYVITYLAIYLSSTIGKAASHCLGGLFEESSCYVLVRGSTPAEPCCSQLLYIAL